MGKYDLHIHTIHSKDSPSTVEDVVKAAKEANLDGIAITDHNTIQGLEEALEFSSKEFLIVPGIEVSSKDGHILGLGIRDKVTSRLSASKTVSEIREKGGIAIAAHPFGLNLKPFSALKANFDAIEVLNPRRYLGNHLAKNYAEKHDIPQFSGSDAHFAEGVGMAGISIEGKPKVEELLKKIKRGEASVFGRTLPLRTYLQRALYKFSAL